MPTILSEGPISNRATLVSARLQSTIPDQKNIIPLPHADLAARLHRCLDVPAVGRCLAVYQSVEAFALEKNWDGPLRAHWQTQLMQDETWHRARADYMDAMLAQNGERQLQAFQEMVSRARAVTQSTLNSKLTAELYAAKFGDGPTPQGDSHLPYSVASAALERLDHEKQLGHAWLEEVMQAAAYEAASAILPSEAIVALGEGGSFLSAAEWAVLGDIGHMGRMSDAARRALDQAKAAAPTEADALGYQVQLLQQQDIVSSDVKSDERIRWGNDVEAAMTTLTRLESGNVPRLDASSPAYQRPIGNPDQLRVIRAALHRLQIRFATVEDMVASGDEAVVSQNRVQEKISQLLAHMKARRGAATEAEVHQLVLAAVEFAQLSTSLAGRVARDYREDGQQDSSQGTMALLHRLSHAANRLAASVSATHNVLQAAPLLQESLAQLHLAIHVDGFRRQGRSFDGLARLQDLGERFETTQSYQDYLTQLAQEAPHQFDYQFPDGRYRLAVQDVSGTPIADESVSRIESWASLNTRHMGRDVGVGLGAWAGGALAGCTLGPKGCVVGGVAGAIAGHGATNQLSIYDHKNAIADARRSGLTDITAEEAERNRWFNTGGLAMAGLLGGFGPGRVAATLGRWGIGAVGAGATIKAGFKTSARDGFKALGTTAVNSAYRVVPREDLFKWGLAGLGLDLFLLHENSHGHTVLSKPDYKLDTWVSWVSAGIIAVSPQTRSVLMGKGALHYAGSFLNEVRYLGTYIAGAATWTAGLFMGRAPQKVSEKALKALAVEEAAKVGTRLQVIERIMEDVPSVFGRQFNKIDLTKLTPSEWWDVALRLRANEVDMAAKLPLGTTTMDDVARLEADNFQQWFNRLSPWRKSQGETYWFDAWKVWRTVDQWKIPEMVRQAQANIRGTRTLYRFMKPLNELGAELTQFKQKPDRDILHGILGRLDGLKEKSEQLFREAKIANIPGRVDTARRLRFQIDRISKDIHDLGHDFKADAAQPGKLLEIQRRAEMLQGRVEALRQEVADADIAMRKAAYEAVNPGEMLPSGLNKPGYGDAEFHRTIAAQQVGYGPAVELKPHPWVQAVFAAPNKLVDTPISFVGDFVSGRVAAGKDMVARYVPSFNQAFDRMVQNKEVARMAYVVNDNGMTTTAPAAIKALESVPRIWVDRTGQALNWIGSLFPKKEIANLHRWGTIPLVIDMFTDPKNSNVSILNPDCDVDTGWGYLGAVSLGNHVAAKLGFNNYLGSAIGTITYFFTLSGIMAQSGEEGDPDWHKHTVNFLSYQTLLLMNPLFFSGVHQANKVPITKAFMLPGLRHFPSMTAFNGMFTRTTSFLKPNLFTPSGLAYSVAIGAPLNGIGLGGVFSHRNLLDTGGYFPTQRLTKKAAAAMFIDPAQNYYGYSGVYSQLGARFFGYFVDLGLNVFTPSFHGSQRFVRKMDRLLDANTPESLDEAWQLFVDQITSLDAGGYFAEVYVSEALRAAGGEPDVTKPVHFGWRMEPYSTDAWVEWRMNEPKKFEETQQDVLKRRGYIEKIAERPKRLKTFLAAFEQQMRDPTAKWHDRDSHGKSMIVFALIAKYYVQKYHYGEVQYRPFADLVNATSMQRFWQGIPQMHTHDDLNQYIESLNLPNARWQALLAPLWESSAPQ